MAVDPKSEDGSAIRKLTPFNTLPGSYFETICNEITVQQAKSGEFLFKRGEQTTDLFFLIDGEVWLQSDEFIVEGISANTSSGKFALAHQIPRKIDAVAKNDIRFIRIAAELIKQPPADVFSGESSFMIDDEVEENDGDWMGQLLKSPIFQRLPAANLQKILMGFQEVSFKQGEKIVGQDEPADYYFFIKSGECILTRKPSPNAREITLAKLAANDTFGEDAIISGNPRNVSVTALTDMELLRMDTERFVTLIKNEILRYIDFQELQVYSDNDCLLLDVRAFDEFKQKHIENSTNIPLFSLRMQLKTLKRKNKIVVICADGRESSTAAYLLIKNKFDAVVLDGGINAVAESFLTQMSVFEVEQDGQETFLAQEPDVEPEINETVESGGQITEIEILREENQRLKMENKNLWQEKQKLDKDYRILLKQTEKLKQVLDRFKTSKPE